LDLSSRTHRPPWFFLCAILFCARAALASPLETPSGAAVFSGPAHPHVLSIYLNPAAIGLGSPGQHWYLGGGVRLDTLNFQRQTGPQVRDQIISPDITAGFFTNVADRGNIGVIFHTPFYQNFPDRSEAGYHVLSGRFWQSLFSLGASWRASGRIFFGAGLSIGISKLQLSLLRDTALEAGSNNIRGIASDCGGAPCGIENPQAAQTIALDVRTRGLRQLFGADNLSLSLGVAYRPGGKWWIGVSYVSPPGVISPLRISGRATVIQAPRDGGQPLPGRATVTFRMPQSIYAGVRGPLLAGYQLVAQLRWQNYSRQEDFDIRLFGEAFRAAPDVPEWYPRYRGFRDVFRADLGMESPEGGRFRFGGRVRFDSGATSATRVTPLEINGPSVGAGLGAEVRLTETVALTGGYDGAWFPRVTATASEFDPQDRLNCVDSNFDYNACEATREGRAIPTAAGDYQRFSHTFFLSIRYDQL
jgi:long-subunit fatty acid transport protein